MLFNAPQLLFFTEEALRFWVVLMHPHPTTLHIWEISAGNKESTTQKVLHPCIEEIKKGKGGRRRHVEHVMKTTVHNEMEKGIGWDEQ